MRERKLGWAIFLAGLPFSPLLMRNLDLWNAQATWAQVWVILLFSLMLMQGQVRRLPKNKPLAAWFLWTCVFFMFVWTKMIMEKHVYPLNLLQGMVHVTIIVIFYITAMQWSQRTLEFILKAIAISGVVTLAYCLLQILNLDQLFNSLGGHSKKDELVGMIGNPSHLGTYLAMLVPIFFIQKGVVWKFFAVGAILLTCATKSAGAVTALFFGMLWLAMTYERWAFFILLGLGIFASLFIYANYSAFFDFNGRLEAWTEFFKIFKIKPITGLGLGFVMEYSRNPVEVLLKWRHVHMEYLQIAIEQGLIGLGIVIWGIVDVFKKALLLQENHIANMLTAIFIIFCVNSFVSYPAHLWTLGSIGLLAYCGIQVIYRDSLSCFTI